jgi:thymidylate synthase
MNNNLDQQYTDLLQDILDNGTKKETRNGDTISVFGRQIRHSMKDGFPLLTTKKMAWRSICTELLWFLKGDTNIKFLVDNNCHIWDGDAYKNYQLLMIGNEPGKILSMTDFIDKIKNDEKFAKHWGDLGPIYGKQWRSWGEEKQMDLDTSTVLRVENGIEKHPYKEFISKQGIDQIANLINDLKTNPDSRRMVVSAWNPAEVDDCVLPPCHYGFQVYTRELSLSERTEYKKKRDGISRTFAPYTHQMLDNSNIPTRAISLMWNQRSVDSFLGLPFNIASYGLLLELIAKAVNMVPDQLIGNLGDVHLYSNHIEQAKEQIGRDLTLDERIELASSDIHFDPGDFGIGLTITEEHCHKVCDEYGVPRRTRQPFTLPQLNINTEFWSYEGGECGEGPLDAIAVFNSFKDVNFCKCLLEEDIQLGNYQSHPAIKAPLSN